MSSTLFATSPLRVWLSLLPPLAAFAVQAHFWDILRPLAFVLGYPAVFCSAWIGGLAGGALATLVSSMAAWLYFLEPRGSFALTNTKSSVALAVFALVGLGVSALQGRLRWSLWQTRHTLDYAARVNQQLERRILERTEQLAGSHRAVDISEARMASIIDSAMDAIISVDAEQRVLLFNAAAERMFGYRSDELLGQPLARLIPSRFREEHAQHIEGFGKTAVASRAMHSQRDLAALRRDGSEFPIEASISHTNAGGLQTFTVILRDVSERKKSGEASALLAAIVESSADAIVGMDLQGVVTSWNAGARDLFGYEVDEIVGRPIMTIVPEARVTQEENLLAALARRMRERTSARLETSHDYPDGSQQWLDVSIQPAPEGLFVLSIDISERKAAAALVRQSDERLRQITQSLPQLIWTTDPSGANDYMGNQWQRYTGRNLEQTRGDGWIETIHPDDLPRLSADWSACLASGADFRCEYRIRRHDGVYRWFDASARALRDDRGNIVKWFGSNTDIDDRRRGQALELRTQKMEALGTLAGGIAHDFNNILFAILGNTQLGELSLASTDPVRENLCEIERASLRARDLVQRILAFSRQEEPKREVLLLRPVIEEALGFLRATVPAIIELRAQFAESVPAVVGDAGQVHQMIVNLATNAAHAIGDRPGVIEIDLDAVHADAELVRSTPGLSEGAYARVSVTDDGCGMSERTLGRIFDPFYTTKPVGQGTGLGLSIVDSLMKAHGGAVTVYSALGKGTAFRLYFVATHDSVPSAEQSLPPVPRASGQRVLYVDDDPALVLLAERALGVLGYAVTGCGDPREALALVREHPDGFEAVVTDLSMPWMSGNELAAKLRALRPSLPVILISGYLRPEDQSLAHSIGVISVVLKPNTVEALARALGQLFAAPRPNSSAGP